MHCNLRIGLDRASPLARASLPSIEFLPKLKPYLRQFVTSFIAPVRTAMTGLITTFTTGITQQRCH